MLNDNGVPFSDMNSSCEFDYVSSSNTIQPATEIPNDSIGWDFDIFDISKTLLMSLFFDVFQTWRLHLETILYMGIGLLSIYCPKVRYGCLLSYLTINILCWFHPKASQCDDVLAFIIHSKHIHFFVTLLAIYPSLLFYYSHKFRHLLWNTRNNFVMGLEGNISAGKSTFGKHVSQLKDVTIVYEKVNSQLLKEFLRNPKENAFPLQMVRMARRLHELEIVALTNATSLTRGQVILDRTVLGDLVFALKHFLDTNMSVLQMQIYSEEMKLNEFEKFVTTQNINGILYLHSRPHDCRQRVQQRGNVDQVTQEDYLNDIDDLHFYGILYLIIHSIVPIYIVTSQQLESPVESEQAQKCRAIYSSIVQNKHRHCRATFVKSVADIPNDVPLSRILKWNAYTEAVDNSIQDQPEEESKETSNKTEAAKEKPSTTQKTRHYHHLEKLGNERFPRLPSRWKYRHNPIWKDSLVAALQTYEMVYIVHHDFSSLNINEDDGTLYSLFEQLSSWNSFLESC
jgi:deoxyadenosine/deoxycytidine kinase